MSGFPIEKMGDLDYNGIIGYFVFFPSKAHYFPKEWRPP